MELRKSSPTALVTPKPLVVLTGGRIAGTLSIRYERVRRSRMEQYQNLAHGSRIMTSYSPILRDVAPIFTSYVQLSFPFLFYFPYCQRAQGNAEARTLNLVFLNAQYQSSFEHILPCVLTSRGNITGELCKVAHYKL